jgi:hypothetical protein
MPNRAAITAVHTMPEHAGGGAPHAPPPWLSWSVWGVAAIYYLAAFYLRSAPAVMTTELMRDFGIAASQLGQFSAFYFYAYIAMQIPTGVLVDSRRSGAPLSAARRPSAGSSRSSSRHTGFRAIGSPCCRASG